MVSSLNIEEEEPSPEKDVSKKDAQRLQDSYRKIFQTMSEGFVLHEVICDENGAPCDLRILDINPAFEQLTGLRKEDVLGRTIKQVLPDEDPLLIKTLGTVAFTGKPIEFENHSKSLERYYKIIAYSPTLLQVAALFSDITKEKDIEDNIKKMEALNKAILDSIPDQIFILSDDGTFLDYRSPFGGELYSPPKSFLGKTMNEVLPAELASQIENKMFEAFQLRQAITPFSIMCSIKTSTAFTSSLGYVNNTFISNVFLENNIAASDSGNNSWSGSEKAEGLQKLTELLLGKKIKGNYYSDYDEPVEGCNDTNQDGLCDQPRNISGGSSVDLYPATSQAKF